MSEDAPYTPETPPWAAPAPPVVPVDRPANPGHSRLKLGIVAAAAGVIVIGGGVAVANAASTGGGVAQQGPGGGPGGPGGYGGGPGGGNFPGGNRGGFDRVGVMGVNGALHGDFVVKDGSGKYVTERLQSGTVTAVSSTSITAKSEDGHSTTFVVGADTKVDNGAAKIADVKTGHTVTIIGVVSGDTATATAITDTALRPTAKASGGPEGRPGGGQRPGRSPQPTPTK